MKISFEGPSGIGKSTLCQLMKKEYKVIPEVNVLFRREKNEDPFWYYRKQVERYQSGNDSEKVIFDGDIFQPLWYNWSYNFPREFLSLKEVHHFYEKEIEKGNIFFPDLYIVFQTSIENLRKRKEKDKTRQRRNFEKHLKLTKTLPRYFGFIKKQFPQLVEFVEFGTIHQAASQVRSIVSNRTFGEKYDSRVILNIVANWLYQNNADT